MAQIVLQRCLRWLLGDKSSCYLQFHVIQNVHIQVGSTKKWLGQNMTTCHGHRSTPMCKTTLQVLYNSYLDSTTVQVIQTTFLSASFQGSHTWMQKGKPNTHGLHMLRISWNSETPIIKSILLHSQLIFHLKNPAILHEKNGNKVGVLEITNETVCIRLFSLIPP